MAKYRRVIEDDFVSVVNFVEKIGLSLGASSTKEESEDFIFEDFQVAIRVFERYSYFGSNRIGLHVTIIKEKDNVHLSAITSGGSQGVVFKINTLGEHNLLAKFEKYMEEYISRL